MINNVEELIEYLQTLPKETIVLTPSSLPYTSGLDYMRPDEQVGSISHADNFLYIGEME